MANGDKKAARTLALSENYDKLLSSILIGNNLVNILSTSLATVLFVKYFPSFGVTLSTIVMTILVLLFGEISPKTLAKEAPEQFAIFSAPGLKVLVTLLTPFNAAMHYWKKLILKVFKFKSDHSISEEELLTYVEEAKESGGINAAEEGMIRSAIEFDDLEAGEIYTPRVDLVAVSVTQAKEEIATVFHETGYSRLPVYRDSIDNIIGMLLEKDFNYFVVTMGEAIEKTLRPVLFVPRNVKISTLLAELQRKKTHMAVLVDDFGGTMGIVTLEDIVEELVGEIWDEHDDIEVEIQKLSDTRYCVLGGTQPQELFRLLDIPVTTTASNVQVVVEEMRRNRVYSVIVTILPPTEEAKQEANYG